MALVAVFMPHAFPASAQPACPPAGYSVDQLLDLKTHGFAMADTAARTSLALALPACLGDPRPELRDGVAFEAFSTWMRGNQLDHASLRTLRDGLQRNLAGPDPDGFRAPFSSLVLAEIARTDRIGPWLTQPERENLVDVAARYLSGITDYRAFTDREGWRHGVAHGADLILQLALNPALSQPQLERLLAALATQVAPAHTVGYQAGESDRLARPVLFIARRGLLSEADWSTWFTRLMRPDPLTSWAAAFQSEAGIVRRHNMRAFLLSLYAGGREADEAGIRAMMPALRRSLDVLSP